MKILLIAVLAVALIAAIAVGVFIATFNVNNYKGALEAQLQAITGNPVEIGKLSMGWNGRILLGVEGVKIFSEGNGKRSVALSLERAEAGIDIAPLLRRELQLSSIYLVKPDIGLTRAKDGKFELRGYSPKKESSSAAKTAAPMAVAFKINVIRISGGAISYKDMTGETPAELLIRMIDADVRNVSISSPVTFAVKGAVAGGRQNLEASGTVGGWLTGSTFIKDFNLQADLAAFAHAEIIKAIPALGKMGLKEGLAGVIKAKIREIEISRDGISKLSGDIMLNGGKLVLNQVRVPIENMALDMSAEGTTLDIRSFSAKIANAGLKVSAKVKESYTVPETDLKLEIDIMGLESFLSDFAGIKQNLDGNAHVTFDGSMTGGAWPEISRSLSGRGTFSLDKGVIMNANVLNQSIGALSVFPDLIGSLQGTGSEPQKKAMVEQYTVLKPLTQSYRIDGGYIILPDLILESDYVDMRGEAKMSLAGDLSGAGMIRFPPDISGAMLKAVPQMRAITDPQGLVTFPIDFKGGGGTFKVIPDMEYIGRRVAVQTAGDAVSGYLKKAMDASDSAKPPESKKPPKIKDFLKALAEEANK